MRLIRTDNLKFEEFHDPDKTPPYAILSHMWGNEEVTFKEMMYRQEVMRDMSSTEPIDDKKLKVIEKKHGFEKIEKTAEMAVEGKLTHIWVDTCAIDKDSSAEISESINSMFKWYSRAKVCYVYLEDVSCLHQRPLEFSFKMDFKNSRWFRRGWTLQELIAPSFVMFVTKEWDTFGHKEKFTELIQEATNIPDFILSSPKMIYEQSVAQRMSWAAMRETTRPEDVAYCLLGLFGVNMPLLYGEGAENAFTRLQEEIIKISDDQSILAWQMESSTEGTWRGPLAKSPKEFALCGRYVRGYPLSPIAYQMTNVGLQISLPLQTVERNEAQPLTLTKGHVVAWLECYKNTKSWGMRIGIVLVRVTRSQYVRVDSAGVILKSQDSDSQIEIEKLSHSPVIIKQRIDVVIPMWEPYGRCPRLAGFVVRGFPNDTALMEYKKGEQGFTYISYGKHLHRFNEGHLKCNTVKEIDFSLRGGHTSRVFRMLSGRLRESGEPDSIFDFSVRYSSNSEQHITLFDIRSDYFTINQVNVCLVEDEAFLVLEIEIARKREEHAEKILNPLKTLKDASII
jgi:Heterokaryon incompatibility protein (HET)